MTEVPDKTDDNKKQRQTTSSAPVDYLSDTSSPTICVKSPGSSQ